MLTLVMAYYDNGGMLDVHLAEWLKWPQEAREGIRAIIVDDASPNDPALAHLQGHPAASPLTGGINVDLYRVVPNIPWNQNGARNLAMQQCRTPWALMTDMDHLLTGEGALAAVRQRRKSGRYYVPSRILASGAPKPRHPNSFIVTPTDFWRAGGYDEDFCGWYGSDKVFRRILDTVAQRHEVDQPQLVLYGREVIPDASTVEFGRKDSKFHSSNNAKLQAKRKAGPQRATNPIRFNWEKVF